MDNEFIELLDEDQILCLQIYELGLDFGNDVPIMLDRVFELGFGEYKFKHLLEKCHWTYILKDLKNRRK